MIVENPRNEENHIKESKAFKISFWALLAIMVSMFVLRDIVFA